MSLGKAWSYPGGRMPTTLQPVIVTPSLPLLLAFYKALLGAVEISRVPDDGPAFYVGLQIGNAELGVVADGEARHGQPHPAQLARDPAWLRLAMKTNSRPGRSGARSIAYRDRP